MSDEDEPDDRPESVRNWKENLRSKQAAAVAAARVMTIPDGDVEPVQFQLSAREKMVATLFADDHSAEQIGVALGLTTETVRSYLRRAREKYAEVGRDASSKLLLRALLVEDGLLTE